MVSSLCERTMPGCDRLADSSSARCAMDWLFFVQRRKCTTWGNGSWLWSPAARLFRRRRVGADERHRFAQIGAWHRRMTDVIIQRLGCALLERVRVDQSRARHIDDVIAVMFGKAPELRDREIDWREQPHIEPAPIDTGDGNGWRVVVRVFVQRPQRVVVV